MPATDLYIYGNPFLNIASLDAVMLSSSDGEVPDGPFAIVDPQPNPEEMTLQAQLVMACERFLALLSQAQREVVELVYWGGLSQADVARALGVSRSAVNQRLEKALEIGRDYLARYRDCCTVH